MTDRTHITTARVLSGSYCFTQKFVLHEHEFCIRLMSNYLTKRLDIDLLIPKDLFLEDVFLIESISERVFVGGDIFIDNCPRLKELPLKMIIGKTVIFYSNQHLITIFSEEQFKSLKHLYIWFEFFERKEIKTYEEYYSLIEPTLNKNNLMKVCL